MATDPHKSFADCSGCSLCLLVCPVWRRTRDIELTPHGRAKALQHGATLADIAASLDTCSLCLACESVCPENIPLTEQMLDQRRQGASLIPLAERQACIPASPAVAAASGAAATQLLADSALLASPALLRQAAAILGAPPAADAGTDIALALETGIAVSAERLQDFLRSLQGARKLVVADALLLRLLRAQLPSAEFTSLAEALNSHRAIRNGLRASDLYVIEPRAYHADYQRLVLYYDGLRAERGCSFNLDLQRNAIPARAPGLPQRLGLAPAEASNDVAQTAWLLKGRQFERIVIEDAADRAAFEKLTQLPVVHLAEVADE